MSNQIDFNNPDEQLVMRAIFSNVPTNQPRGFTDVFSELEILQMAASKTIDQWEAYNRAWISQTAADLVDSYEL